MLLGICVLEAINQLGASCAQGAQQGSILVLAPQVAPAVPKGTCRQDLKMHAQNVALASTWSSQERPRVSPVPPDDTPHGPALVGLTTSPSRVPTALGATGPTQRRRIAINALPGRRPMKGNLHA